MAFVGNSQRTDKIFGEQVQALKPKALRANLEAQLVQLMQKRSAELIRFHHTDNSKLKFIHDKRGVSVYEGISGKNQLFIKTETTVRASIEDILGVFHMGNTHDFDATLLKLFDLYANMGATIAYTANYPITVHWMGLNTDKAETRDIVFASYAQLYEQNMQGQLVPDLNRDGVIVAGSLVWESIDIAGEIPILRQKQTGCSRYTLRNSGFYVQQTSDVDVSRVSLILSLENESGYVRSSKWMHGLAMCIANLSKALRKIELVPKMLWKESEHCVMCRKTFRAFRRRHHCRLCGNSVCGDCSKTIHLDIPAMDQDQHVSSVRACSKCFEVQNSQSLSSSRSRSRRSSSDYSSSRHLSFDDANKQYSMRSVASSSTKSLDGCLPPQHYFEGSSHGVSGGLRGVSSSSQQLTVSSSVISTDQIHSLDMLMAASSIDRPSNGDSMLFVIPGEASNIQHDRESYNTLHDRSSTSSQASVGPADFPATIPAPAPLAIKPVMKGDMILLQ
ncbi:unnamed protein product [Aphanomyces euteiches]